MIWKKKYFLGLICITKIRNAPEGRCPLYLLDIHLTYLMSYQWSKELGMNVAMCKSYSLVFEIINFCFLLKVNPILISLMDPVVIFRQLSGQAFWVYLSTSYEMYHPGCPREADPELTLPSLSFLANVESHNHGPHCQPISNVYSCLHRMAMESYF